MQALTGKGNPDRENDTNSLGLCGPGWPQGLRGTGPTRLRLSIFLCGWWLSGHPGTPPAAPVRGLSDSSGAGPGFSLCLPCPATTPLSLPDTGVPETHTDTLGLLGDLSLPGPMQALGVARCWETLLLPRRHWITSSPGELRPVLNEGKQWGGVGLAR